MKKHCYLSILFIVFTVSKATVEHSPLEKDPEKDHPVVTLNGYTKLDAFYDSRQIDSNRQGEDLFSPKEVFLDIHCRDINANDRFHMVAVETRFALTARGPDVLCAKAYGYIEGDFFAITDANIQEFRMRHAFVALEGERHSVLFGQFWHPFFHKNCFPHTISFNTGSPIESFAREPQIRYTYNRNGWEFVAAMLTERTGNQSDGPLGFSVEYLDNSVVPMLDARLQYRWYDNNFVGVGVDFIRLTPRLFSQIDPVLDGFIDPFNVFDKQARRVKTHEKINSVNVMAYAKVQTNHVACEFKGIYSENGTHLALLSGYAVATHDNETGKRTYANWRSWSLWGEVAAVDRKVKPGIFFGYSKVIGSDRPLYRDPALGIIDPIIYAANERIDYIARIVPRVIWDEDPVRFAVEIEYTRAAFAQPRTNDSTEHCVANPNAPALNRFGQVINPTPVTNVRFLMAAYYFF